MISFLWPSNTVVEGLTPSSTCSLCECATIFEDNSNRLVLHELSHSVT